MNSALQLLWNGTESEPDGKNANKRIIGTSSQALQRGMSIFSA